MELCCHQININTKEKNIIRSILKHSMTTSIYTLPQKKHNFPRCVSFETECTLRKKVEPKWIHPWSRLMVWNSAPPVALFWHHLRRWSCFRLKKVISWEPHYHYTGISQAARGSNVANPSKVFFQWIQLYQSVHLIIPAHGILYLLTKLLTGWSLSVDPCEGQLPI